MISTKNTRMQARPGRAGPRQAFTLIELLVVVAIIALLVAILLPSLGKAREYSRAVSGLSNLRQIGIAFYGYANENEMTFPLGQVSGKYPDGSASPYYVWYLSLNPYLGGQGNTNDDPTLQRPLPKVLQDPSAAFLGGECHYSSNAMVLPTWDYHNQGWWPNVPRYNPAYKTTTLTPPSDVITITDGVQVCYGSAISGAPKGTATPVAWWFNNFLWNYGGGQPYSYREINAPPWKNASKLVRITDTLENGSNPDWQLDMTSSFTVPWPSIRFRQWGGKGMNCLFADGHAETKRLDNLVNGDFLANRNW